MGEEIVKLICVIPPSYMEVKATVEEACSVMRDSLEVI